MEEEMVGCVEDEGKKKEVDSGCVLRPEELGDHFDLPSHLPTRGKKEVLPDGSEKQQHKLQRLCEQQDKLLREQKVAKVNRVAVGEWNQSKQLVEVKVEKGKFWQTMGYHSNGKKYLYPEEGLFLLEMNVMELRHGKVPISVQQAYELMIPYQFSLEHYQVYSHLMRLGYITTRHKESDISDYEYRINLDQFRHRQKQAYKKVQGWFQQMNENTTVTQEYFESDGDSGRDQKSIKSTGSMSFGGISGKAIVGEAGSSSSGEKVQLLPGSGVSSDTSSPDNDDSSVYSDGPVEPHKQANSEVPSINLLEFHKKYFSSADNSVVSSNNNKNQSTTNSHGEKVAKESTMDSTACKQSRKRKSRDSHPETSTDDQAETKQRKKIKGQTDKERAKFETKIKDQNMSLKNTDVGVRLAKIETKLCDGAKNEKLNPKVVGSAVLNDSLIIKEKDSKKIIDSDKIIDKNTRDDSGKDSESRRSSDGSIKEYPTRKWTDNMEITSYHCVRNKSRSYQSINQSSDLGTDLSVYPSSLDVDIDDVLGLLSPSSAKNDSNDDGDCKYTPWNFKQIILPNLVVKKTVELPPPEFLPDSIALEVKERQSKTDVVKESKAEGETKQPDILQELDKVNQLLKTSNELMESTTIMLGIENKQAEEPVIGGKNIENVRRLFPSKPAAANWGEYKKLTSNEEQIEGLTSVIQSPVSHLWKGEVQPLVKPSDAVSTSYLLHKLQIIQNANLTSQHVSWPYNSTPCQECKISFDVFQPDTGYKKSKPGQPAFKVVVSSVTDPIPDLATQASLLKLSKPVQLLWAVVDTNSDVAFYSLKDLELPVDVTMGW